MGKFLVNLLICILAFLPIYWAASLLSFAWFEAFITPYTFREYLGFIAGNTLLVWAFYLAFFLAIGLGLSAILSTTRTLPWAAAFGCVYSLYRLFAGHTHILHPNAYVYVSLSGEYFMPVIGCLLGAILGRRIRRLAPNKSFKPNPLRGSA